MPDERKERLEAVLEKALAIPAAQRSHYVAVACEQYPDIAAELTSLLQSDQDSSLTEFLEEGLPGILRGAAASAPDKQQVNETKHLQEEENEERHSWEGRFVGDDFNNGGRYEIVMMRRFGLMASLFFARDRKVGSPVVIKIPRRCAYLRSDSHYEDAGNLNANIRNNFRREFDALRKLQRCSYVVKVLDFGQLPDGRPFMVQEFIDGKNALELLNSHNELAGKRTGLAFKDVINIVRQAGRGLEAAHELSILHRDMKSENVMVTHDGHVKLIDFNAADVKLPITALSTVFNHQTWGTLGYASPEQLHNMMDGDVAAVPLTAASDIYSLAVTAYQLLTGKMPFSSNVTELIKQQAACSFVRPSEIRQGLSSEIDALFSSALNADPALRPQTVQEFTNTLARNLEEVGYQPTQVTTSEVNRLARSPSHRSDTQLAPTKRAIHGKLIITVLSAVLSVAAISAWLLTKNKNTHVVAANPSLPVRSFSYWLDLTRVAKAKTTDTTIRASGQEVFTNGDQFKVNFLSPYSGYLYLLNEGRNYDDKATFYYIGKYPVKAGVQMSSSPLGFDNKDGTEQFWFVFSERAVDIFEERQPPFEIPWANTERIQKYLNESVPADLTSKEDMSTAQTNVTGSGETIACKVLMRHRRSE